MAVCLMNALVTDVTVPAYAQCVQQKMVSELAKGDEIITTGGIAGRITKVSDDFVTVAIADNVEIQMQKPAIATVLPKGTLKNL